MRMLILLCTIVLLGTACSGSKKSTKTSSDKSDNLAVQDISATKKDVINDVKPDQTLDQYLRKVPGVIVRGSGSNVSVRIRGVGTTLNSSAEPLFILDGNQVGRDLGTVAGLINVNDIKSVTVLKDASETAFYGSQGANGVIVIKSKK
ncbi:MAG: TonB-dependent receptor plug domain-containing protein [Bacteroidota bacterium]